MTAAPREEDLKGRSWPSEQTQPEPGRFSLPNLALGLACRYQSSNPSSPSGLVLGMLELHSLLYNVGLFVSSPWIKRQLRNVDRGGEPD